MTEQNGGFTKGNYEKEQNKIMKIVQGPDGMMYKVSPDGDMELIETKRSIGPAGASTVSDDGKRMITRAKGGMVKKYMGGGSVHKKKNKMLTTKGWGASRKT